MAKVKTGTAGLDAVLAGGLPAARLYLLQGDPGVGKTTLAMQFLMEGARHKESVLYVTLSESQTELDAIAESHGWDLTGISVYEMTALDSSADVLDQENTLYAPDEIELNERMASLMARIAEVDPTRVVIDSCSELRLLARTPLRFRRQLLALKADLLKRGSTVLLLENPIQPGGDVLLQSLVHGVIEMCNRAPLYGAERRHLRVIKMREVAFQSGAHDSSLSRGGIEVYPRLVASDHHLEFIEKRASSGIPALDDLTGGGLEHGTCTLLLGPAGTGKSALATRFAYATCQRKEKATVFVFDENVPTLLARSAGLGMDLGSTREAGLLDIQQLDPTELSPGNLVQRVRDAVERNGVTTIVIDSLNGYLHALPDDKLVLPQLHELLSYLRQRGVVTILVVAQHGVVGSTMNSVVDVSYLADNILMLRHFEVEGRVRKAVSVLKKRAGKHEDSIRELRLGDGTIALGPPLSGFRGVLTGIPVIEQSSIEHAEAERPG